MGHPQGRREKGKQNQKSWAKAQPLQEMGRLRRVDLGGGDDFGEVVEDFGGVGGLDAGIGIGIGAGGDLEEELVAGAVGKAGVVAVEFARAHGGGASLDPGESEALDGGGAEGDSVVGGGGESVAGVWRESGVDDELESAADESGIGIGVGRNGDEGDEDGAGLVGGELLLGFGEGGVFGVGGFVEEIGARIAERDAVGGIVVDGEGGVTRRMLGGGRGGGLGFGS